MLLWLLLTVHKDQVYIKFHELIFLIMDHGMDSANEENYIKNQNGWSLSKKSD